VLAGKPPPVLKMPEPIVTNLLGRYARWWNNGHSTGGTITAVTFYQGGFVLLVLTDQGLQTKTATGVSIE